MTLRAIRVLKEVAAVACEDTRQTQKLLDHYGIRKPLVSYHEHNEQARTTDLIARLEGGDDIALVTDAGVGFDDNNRVRVDLMAFRELGGGSTTQVTAGSGVSTIWQIAP